MVKVADLPQSRKPFRFFNFWADHPSFLPLVQEVWREEVRGSPMFQLCTKLKSLKRKLKELNNLHFSDIQGRVMQAKARMDSLQRQIQDNPTDPYLCAEEVVAVKNYGDLCRAEESFLRQKSRVQWLNLGDQNTEFFFRMVKSRQGRNKIVSIVKEDGSRVDNPTEIKDEIVRFFQNLLSSTPRPTPIDMDLLDRVMTRKVSTSQCFDLVKEVSDEEIKEVFFSLKDNKSPGLDGFNALFFKRAWCIVGQDVIKAIKSFFQSGRLLKELNTTAIALIPKIPNPDKLKDFRPISCCNTVYKCIAKIMANRLKVVLPNLVGPQQTAFIQGRRIGDNVLLVQDLLRNYHRNTGTPRCALKVDLMKAYDTVRWDFIRGVLKASGFPEAFVQWIMECVTTTSFSISINGELKGFFQGGRALRQGDPLSPYLFVLVMEAFSGLMNDMIQQGHFKYHWRCQKLKISHLFFADD